MTSSHKNWFRHMCIAGSVIALAACAQNLNTIKRTEITPSNFNTALASDYKSYAMCEASQKDWRDAEHFATKGVESNNGADVGPDEIANRKVKDAGAVDELNHARQCLTTALTGQVKGHQPADAARAQSLFDCWAEQQEEGWQEGHIMVCREEFYAALAKLVPVTTYTVYFTSGSAAVNGKDAAALRKIARDLKKGKTYRIQIAGHTDREGNEKANQSLSNSRVSAVKGILTNAGLSSKMITVKGFGEAANAVPTPDNAKEAKNRRVEVIAGGKGIAMNDPWCSKAVAPYVGKSTDTPWCKQ